MDSAYPSATAYSVATATSTYAISLPINYEDTDAGGVVYYANYLGYMERARNAALRSIDLPLSRLLNNYQLVFVVTEAQLKYRAPAYLDDVVHVTLRVGELKHASLVCHQCVRREQQILVDARIKLATLHCHRLTPMRMPPLLRDGFARFGATDRSATAAVAKAVSK